MQSADGDHRWHPQSPQLLIVHQRHCKMGRGERKLEKLGPPFWDSKHPRILTRGRFCESGEVVRLPRERADLRGSLGNFWGSPGNFRGSLGKFRGTSGLLLNSTVRELPENSPGNFRGTSGNFRGLSRSSGEPDSLPATRQICLWSKDLRTFRKDKI